MMQLEKLIEDVALRLPELPPLPRKNLFDILGVRNKETLNSRVLAYFLDKDEDHGFGPLFFDGLMNIYSSKCDLETEDFSGDYLVTTEETTVLDEVDKQKSIDISLDGRDWSIIIENKLYHNLTNPLDVYWNHKKGRTDNVIGIILSLHSLNASDCVAENGVRYINITHSELIDAVQENFILGEKVSSTSLLYLNEYIKTIQSHYSEEKDKTVMNEIVKALRKQGEEVIKIETKVLQAVTFLDGEVLEIFRRKGYSYDSSKKHYHRKKSPYQIRFWVNGGKEIILKNELRFGIESFGHTNEIIRENEKDFFDFLKYSTKDNSFFIYGNTNNRRKITHLVKYTNQKFLNYQEVFIEKFEQLIDEYFFESGGIVDKIEEYLSQHDLPNKN